MDVIKVFEELDTLTKPSSEEPLLAKAFKLNVERFLQHARPQLSWSHTFHERLLKTHNLLTHEKYTQYVDAMKWYIENCEGSILPTKMQRVCASLVYT
jgi:hypothetical protein